jgi:hypothetical protein
LVATAAGGREAPVSVAATAASVRLGGRELERHAAPAVAILTIATVLMALGYGMNHTSYVVWGGFLVAPVLLILSLPIASRAARLDGDVIGRIVLLGAGIKVLIAPVLRYWMTFSVYDGNGDAGVYHAAGTVLAPLFRSGIYGDLGQISGTRFVEILTGHVYVLTGPTRLGGFMVFSWFAFLGCYLFYRAFRVAYPDGDGRRYALLVFFFPTLLFWPSSIGKEAFMMLVLGAAALGAAQLTAGRFRGLMWLGLGLWGSAIVRPHIALIVGVALAVAAPIALVAGDTSGERRDRRRLGGAVLVLALLLSGPTVIGLAETFLKLDSLSTESTREKLGEVTEQTAQGGSRFGTLSPNNPLGFAVGAVTVLFRPFPMEAHNTQAVLAGLEGVALLALCVASVRRLARLPRQLFRRPYAAFALVYTFAFIYAFTSVVNFGILVRQRAQLLPVLFVAMCIPSRDGAPT